MLLGRCKWFGESLLKCVKNICRTIQDYLNKFGLISGDLKGWIFFD
jgi:hypothetical protein